MPKTIIERFLEKVDKEVCSTTSCWVWVGATNGKGYGQFYCDGRNQLAHRVSYQLYVGEIPEGLTVDHQCENTICVNPDHLKPMTLKENIAKGDSATAVNGRKTHCPQGHEYTKENTLHKKRGRYCRICQRAYTQDWRDKQDPKIVRQGETISRLKKEVADLQAKLKAYEELTKKESARHGLEKLEEGLECYCSFCKDLRNLAAVEKGEG